MKPLQLVREHGEGVDNRPEEIWVPMNSVAHSLVERQIHQLSEQRVQSPPDEKHVVGHPV